MVGKDCLEAKDIKVFKMRSCDKMEPLRREIDDTLTYITGKNHLEVTVINDEIGLEVFLDGDKVLLRTYIHQDLGIHAEVSRVNQLLQHCGFFVSMD